MIQAVGIKTIIGWLVAVVAAAYGYGQLKTTVESQDQSIREVKADVREIRQHLSWGQRGEVGPAPPVESK